MTSVAHGIAVAVALLWCAAPRAQEFPSKPVRIVVPTGPGGGTDILGRTIAKELAEPLRQTVFVENRPGAGSIQGTEYVAKAAPDGHTLLVTGISAMVMHRALRATLPYDSLRDFAVVGFAAAYPFLLLARADLPVATVEEFVKYSRERPGRVSFASAGVGSLQHVWAAILFHGLGLNVLHVPYKAAAAGHQDLMGGRVDVMFDNLSASKKYVEAGRLKGLAVSSSRRAAQLPAVPTVLETGLASFEGESWMGVFAPAATPASIIERLRSVLANTVAHPEFAARIDRDGGRVMTVPPRDQQRFLQSEIERWSRAVLQAGVTTD